MYYVHKTVVDHARFTGFDYEYEYSVRREGKVIEMFHVSPVVGPLFYVQYLHSIDRDRRYIYNAMIQELSAHLVGNDPDVGFSAAADSVEDYAYVFETMRLRVL